MVHNCILVFSMGCRTSSKVPSIALVFTTYFSVYRLFTCQYDNRNSELPSSSQAFPVRSTVTFAGKHIYHRNDGSSIVHASVVSADGEDDDHNMSKESAIDVIPSKYVQKKSRSDSRNVTIECSDDELMMPDKIVDRKFIERNTHWIILVDDELSIRQSVGDFLYDSGYQVTACADAYAFVELFRSMTTSMTGNAATKNSGLPIDAASITTSGILPINNAVPSCIISDIRMPGGPDGIELLQLVRSSDLLKRIPVILLTAKGMTQDRITGYQAGADAYVPKPFDPDELLSIIDTIIVRRKQMTGTAGALLDLQLEMASVKMLLQQNVQSTVQATNVYLTPATREILNLLCQGYTNSEIAQARNTTKPYVTKVLKRMYDETGTATRTDLLRWAIKTGYVNPKQ